MEFTGTTAALALIDRLLHGYGEDDRVTTALDTRTFYVVPRVNPDGAEAGLGDGRYRRSSVRPYPREEPQDGLHREDVDGDGRALMMRQPDPNGHWKRHPDDPRLLVARRPDDVSGEFFRVFPEGTIRNWDGVTVTIAPAFEGLDLNRNWPADWAPEGEQLGAGPYPTSEPETRALVQAIVDGPVELGGWDLVRFWYSPPLSKLEEEVRPHADFALFLALVSPRLEVRSFESEAVAGGAHRLRLVLQNSGWLPTNVTQKALERKAVLPIEVELELPEGSRIVTGKEREEAGQLEGRVERRTVPWWNVDYSTSDLAKLEWVVEAKAGERVGVVARHERAGTVRAELIL
jgi:Zinc carboxypeptidase